MSFKVKISLIFIVIFMGSFSVNTDGTLVLARIYFDKAIDDEQGAQNLRSVTEDKNDKAIFVAYNGAAYALLAKHVINPFRKIENLNKGLAQLNRSAGMDPKDIEVRFLRFSVEENIPPVVQFTKHLQEDKTFILQQLQTSHPIYQKIKGYLMMSKSLTSEERKSL